MRQWMVDTRILCRKHLLGEHVEHHMFIGTLKRKKSVKNFLAFNLFEPESLQSRHDEIAIEMTRRGYNHKSQIDFQPEYLDYLGDGRTVVIDRESALADLVGRCDECKKNYDALVGNK